jgi:hypothetical protein
MPCWSYRPSRQPDGLFALRGREIAAGDRADRTVAANAIQRELDAAVATLVGEAETGMAHCAPSTRSGDARAGAIHSRTFTGTSGSYG